MARLCEDGSKRMNVFVAPSILDKLEKGASDSEMQYLALSVAGFLRFYTGETEKGDKINYQDNMAEALQPLAQ